MIWEKEYESVTRNETREHGMQHGTTDRLGHHICDYSDTDYKAFWADGTRDYEDTAERIALRRLSRSISGSCLEIGAGYGRLVNEYADRCDSVLLTDYAENLLEQAREHVRQLGLDQVECLVWNLYELEQLGRQFDNAVCVRVLHHVEDVPEFFRQVNLALCDGGCFIFEFANKRNLMEISRWLLRRPNIAPFDRQPTARKDDVYYNFHPDYIREQLRKNGFAIEQELSVSLFRNKTLKRIVPAERLAAFERPLQAGAWRLSPSIFIRARKVAHAEAAHDVTYCDSVHAAAYRDSVSDAVYCASVSGAAAYDAASFDIVHNGAACIALSRNGKSFCVRR